MNIDPMSNGYTKCSKICLIFIGHNSEINYISSIDFPSNKMANLLKCAAAKKGAMNEPKV